jgi:hypothetical protein
MAVGAALAFSTARAGILGGLSAIDLIFMRFLVAGLIMLPFLVRWGLPELAGIGLKRGLILTALAGCHSRCCKPAAMPSHPWRTAPSSRPRPSPSSRSWPPSSCTSGWDRRISRRHHRLAVHRADQLERLDRRQRPARLDRRLDVLRLEHPVGRFHRAVEILRLNAVLSILIGIPIVGEIPSVLQIVGLVLMTIGLLPSIGVFSRLMRRLRA